jgi:hypothetical protein
MPKHLVRLLSGSFSQDEATKLSDTAIEKAVMLVYAGKFESMDGPVEVTDQHIEQLAANHNTLFSKLKHLAAGDIPLKNFPPIQLDHSVSAHDTVGRLVGELTVGEFDDGSGPKKALMGKMRILGRENVEKVQDGRWTHVSIGADLDKCTVSELTITPFPAAPNASMLSQNRNSQGDDGMKEKLKKHLMEQKQMSAEDADKHLAALSKEDEEKLSAEVDEHEKKLAAAKDEEEKKLAAETEEKEKKLSAAKSGLVKLAKDMRSGQATATLASKKLQISNRLARLRAGAKVTPAEIKKIDIAELSGKSDEALDLFFKGFEAREPQVLPGMAGTASGENIAAVARNKKISALAAQVRGDMPFMKQVDKNRLAEGDGEDKVNVHIDTAPHTDEMDDADMAAIEKMMDEDVVRAKQLLREYCKKFKSRMTEGADSSELTEQQEKTSEELASELKKLQTHNEQLLKLVGELTGETI